MCARETEDTYRGRDYICMRENERTGERMREQDRENERKRERE